MNSTASGTTPYRPTNNLLEALIYPQALTRDRRCRSAAGDCGCGPRLLRSGRTCCASTGATRAAAWRQCRRWDIWPDGGGVVRYGLAVRGDDLVAPPDHAGCADGGPFRDRRHRLRAAAGV